MHFLPQFAFLASLCGLLSAVAAVTPIEVKGSQFVNPKTSTRFQMIGVEYVVLPRTMRL